MNVEEGTCSTNYNAISDVAGLVCVASALPVCATGDCFQVCVCEEDEKCFKTVSSSSRRSSPVLAVKVEATAPPATRTAEIKNTKTLSMMHTLAKINNNKQTMVVAASPFAKKKKKKKKKRNADIDRLRESGW